MIRRLSECCAACIIRRNNILEGKKSIIVYGFELLISSIIGLLLLAGISIVLRQPLSLVAYLVGFVPLRTTAGGYHAKTHTRCYILICLLFCLSIIAANLIPLWAPLPICLCSLLLIVLFSPVETLNKPLSKSRKMRNRYLSIGIMSAASVLALIIVNKSAIEKYSIVFFMGIQSAIILFVLELTAQAKNKYRKEKKL